MEAAVQRAGRWMKRSVHELLTCEAQETTSSTGIMTCEDFGWITSLQAVASSMSHGGRAKLEYLKTHPEDDMSIHVVL
jgi:hypothetical protein